MSKRQLRNRPITSTMKARENAETEAMLQFHQVVNGIEKSQIKLAEMSGACSASKLNKSVSELAKLKTKLDVAYQKVQNTAISVVSTTVRRKADRLAEELTEMTRQLNATEEHTTIQPNATVRSEYEATSDRSSSNGISRARTSKKNISLKQTQNPRTRSHNEHSISTKLSHRAIPRDVEHSIGSVATTKHSSSNYTDDHSEVCSNLSDSTIDQYLNDCDHRNAYPIDVMGHTDVNLVELSKMLAESLNASRLPAPEPEIFAGNPLEYHSWKCAFETLIECKSIKANERIHYLKRYLSGEARKAVESVFFFNSESPYNRAREILEKRYGNSFLVSEALRDKLYKWPKLSSKDYIGLRDIADYLQQCNIAMENLKELEILNDCRENKRLLQKFPEWLVQRWSRIVAKDLNSYPKFSQFALFVSQEADIVCNPLLSTLSIDEPEDQKYERKYAYRKVSTFQTENNTDECHCCEKQNHILKDCRIFLSKTPDERNEIIYKKGICFSCLQRGHISRHCTNKLSCSKCQKRHPTCLHDDIQERNSSRLTTKPDIQTTNVVNEGDCMKSLNNRTSDLTSMIVPVFLSSHSSDESVLVYALLDTQSDSTFILDSVAEKLNVKSEATKLKLTTMTSTSIVSCRKYTQLTIRGFYNNKVLNLPTTYSREFIPVRKSHIPAADTASRWPHLHYLKDKIPALQDCEIGLLIGYDCSEALRPLEVITGKEDEPYAVNTHIGWSIVGITRAEEKQYSPSCFNAITLTVPDDIRLEESHTNTTHFSLRTSCREIIQILESDFIERKTDSDVMSQDDIRFMKIMKSETRIDENGFYEMPLPFKTDNPWLPNNRSMVERRLEQLKRRLSNNDILYNDYKTFMNMMFDKQYAEICTEVEKEDSVKWYIPHHAVYHKKKSGSARVVFDCSSSYHSQSLNKCLIQGPDLLNCLIKVLSKFREYPIAIIGDIEKMFYRFKVKKDHRNYLRFLWWKNGDIHSTPITCRMTVHIFGATSSPGCANFALKKLARDNINNFSRDTINFFHDQFYVDDGLYSTKSLKDAIQLVDESRQLCNIGQLRLHKFVSNNRQLMEHIPESERADTMKSVDLNFDELPVERALGICWNTDTDSLQFTTNAISNCHPIARRKVLSIIASLYDPLGCVAPFILKGKIILQQMCKENLSWDEPLPAHLEPRWKAWFDDLPLLSTLDIPRCFITSVFGTVIRRELHHFSDASSIGYGQCTYIRQLNDAGEVQCCLVIGKARVTPLKMITIPRAELTAAHLSVKISKLLKNTFDNIDAEYYWSDSQIVLSYLNNDSKRFHIYVANRVQQIKDHCHSKQWNYIQSDMNPADLASRGSTVETLSKSTWFKGPLFLWNTVLPDRSAVDIDLSDDDPEVRAQVMHTITTPTDLIMFNRFSSWSTASKVILICLRFKNMLLKKSKNDNEVDIMMPDDVGMLEYSKLCIIRCLQQHVYQQEMCILRDKRKLPPNHKLAHLDPFLDNVGLLRVGGRIQKASFLYGVKHPVIIPKNHHVTNLIIGYYHEESKHQGRGLTMNAIRSSGIWIIGCSRAVASYVHKCVTCRWMRGREQCQKMCDLPDERLEPSPPFTYVGVDCFGPFTVKNGRKIMKKYGLVVTCFSSRAIHIELLDDMTSDAFINALRCVIAIRGPIRTIKCDQGSNFKGAAHELKIAMSENLEGDLIKKQLLNHQCEFVFNSPYASHMGGIWERSIRTIRSVLNTILWQHPSQLDSTSLRTFLYEVMAIVNGRPLTLQNMNDPDSPIPLTPNHLLTFKSNVIVPPPGSFDKDDIYARKRWRKVQSITNEFWKRWRSEYVLSMQNRQKWLKAERNISVGDVMLIRDDDLPRNCWKLGRVTGCIPSADGHVRRVKLDVGTSTLCDDGKRRKNLTQLERPIHKLILIYENES